MDNNQPPIQVSRIERVLQAAAEILDDGHVLGADDESINDSLRVEANESRTSGEHSLMRFSISTRTGDSLLERRAHQQVFLMSRT